MNQHRDISRLIKGTTQGTQTPNALDPRQFAVDERNSMQRLGYCVEVASVLDYYNQEGVQDGAWDSFLLADVSMLTAWITRYDSSESYSQFLDFLNAIKTHEERKKLESFTYRFFNLGFEVVLTIDNWYKLSNQNFASNSMTEYLRDTIRTKGSELLASFYYGYFTLTENLPSFKNEIVARFNVLDPLWGFNPFPDVSSVRKSNHAWKKNLINTVEAAAEPGQQLFNLQAEITNTAGDEFILSQQRNNIPPHIGLLLTFTDLFKTQVGALNTLTARHLDFYYHSVLRGTKSLATPDTTFITLQLAKGQTTLNIPKDTELSAGKDANGETIVFATVDESVITSTQILEYRTLSLSSNNNSLPVSGMYAGVVSKFNSLGNETWPLFGGDTSTGNLAVCATTLGFAFSCSDLLLSQGSRTVNITFTLEPGSGSDLTGKDLGTYFDLQLTASKGWYTAMLNQVTYGDDTSTLLISFVIDPADPAIVAYSEKVHGTGYNASWPVCKISLATPGKQAYRSLQKLMITNLSIATTVTGVFDFLVENDSGKLAAALPFIPFNDPSPGANLYIGSQEFFVKQLTYLKLTIAWDKLPASFENYYQAYNDYYSNETSSSEKIKTPVFQNQVFKGKMYVLDGEVWIPVAGNNNLEEYCLFTEEATPAPDCNNSAEKYAIEGTTVTSSEIPLVTKGAKVIHLYGPFPFNPHLQPYTSLGNNLQEGFFCLTLSEPSKGFGAIDYPTIVSTVTLENSIAAMHNARLIVFHKMKIKPMPNVPYVPKVSGLQIEYASSQEYPIGPSQTNVVWYYLHPLGIEPVSFQQASVSMLPAYQNQVYAYFGLDTIQPNTDVSFFLSLTNRVKSVSTDAPSGITYEYLTDDGWRSLIVTSDSTEGFQRTGVIKVAIPADISNTGTTVPSGLYWLRFGQAASTNVTTNFVATQAVPVVRQLTTNGKYTPIVEGSIAKFINPAPGIKAVVQPVCSFGGSPQETKTEFRKRVAGRLRYKQRALSASDIEGMVLNEFPQLFKVTASPAGYKDPKSIGLVKVIVTPWTTLTVTPCYEPLASLDLMLDIFNFLQGIGMPSARYEVSNPDFCMIKVTCTVAFSTPNRNAELINKLNIDICNFLSPWVQDNPLQDVPTTNSPDGLYAFIQSRPYVDYVSAYRCDIVDTGNDFVMPVGNAPSTPFNYNGVTIPEILIIPSSSNAITAISSTGQQLSDRLPDGLRIGETFYLTD